ncbi:MAG: TA system VapC family ribonuclease toxin [Bryobacteraceae bacterium]
MNVLDANILLYAYDTKSPIHSQARTWLQRTFSSNQLIGLPWQSIAAFLRVITNSRLPGDRYSPEEASQVIDKWLEQPNVRLLIPGQAHWPLLRQTIIEGQVRGSLISDAELAALTIEYGGVLYTTDRDFARFPGLRWTNPLQQH